MKNQTPQTDQEKSPSLRSRLAIAGSVAALALGGVGIKLISDGESHRHDRDSVTTIQGVDPLGPDGGITAPPNPSAPNAQPEHATDHTATNPIGPDSGMEAPPNPSAP